MVEVKISPELSDAELTSSSSGSRRRWAIGADRSTALLFPSNCANGGGGGGVLLLVDRDGFSKRATASWPGVNMYGGGGGGKKSSLLAVVGNWMNVDVFRVVSCSADVPGRGSGCGFSTVGWAGFVLFFSKSYKNKRGRRNNHHGWYIRARISKEPNQSINQSITQTINQSIDRTTINQSIDHTNNQSIDRTTTQSSNQFNRSWKWVINQSINQSTDRSKPFWMWETRSSKFSFTSQSSETELSQWTHEIIHRITSSILAWRLAASRSSSFISSHRCSSTFMSSCFCSSIFLANSLFFHACDWSSNLSCNVLVNSPTSFGDSWNTARFAANDDCTLVFARLFRAPPSDFFTASVTLLACAGSWAFVAASWNKARRSVTGSPWSCFFGDPFNDPFSGFLDDGDPPPNFFGDDFDSNSARLSCTDKLSATVPAGGSCFSNRARRCCNGKSIGSTVFAGLGQLLVSLTVVRDGSGLAVDFTEGGRLDFTGLRWRAGPPELRTVETRADPLVGSKWLSSSSTLRYASDKESKTFFKWGSAWRGSDSAELREEIGPLNIQKQSAKRQDQQ